MTEVRRRGADWALALPPVRMSPVEDISEALTGAPRLVVLDDDPTGTQTVRGVPVLTRWAEADLEWALRQSTPGFFVLTNSRGMSPKLAADRIREIATRCYQVAREARMPICFASRSDSTLRGHYPLETNVLAQVIAENGGIVDGVLLSPAYLDAGRLTLDGIQWLRTADGLLPVSETEYARDATFAYRSSRLADWVQEKTSGRISASQVQHIDIRTIRAPDSSAIVSVLNSCRNGQVVVVDAIVDDDVRVVAAAALAAQSTGIQLLYQLGPSFARALLGQGANPQLSDEELRQLVGHAEGHGLIVVGSHVGLTTRQLRRLRERRGFAAIEVDVGRVAGGTDSNDAQQHLAEVICSAAAALADGPTVVCTSRTLLSSSDPHESLSIAGRISVALTQVVSGIVARRRPAFVVAKGGITSSDIATGALRIDRAWVRGSLLPGIVSLWEAADGPATGLPFAVFAGNVGDDDSLADVVDRLAPP